MWHSCDVAVRSVVCVGICLLLRHVLTASATSMDTLLAEEEGGYEMDRTWLSAVQRAHADGKYCSISPVHAAAECVPWSWRDVFAVPSGRLW